MAISLDDKMYSVSENKRESESSIAGKIQTALKNSFGSDYNNKYRSSLIQNGYTGKLYESMSFEKYKHISWFLAAGSTLSAIASLIALPQSAVLKILTFVGSAATGYSLRSDYTSNKYVANVNNNKSVEVNNTYPYRAGRTEYGYCYVGDKSAAYVSSNKVKEDYDFRDNTALLKKGIQNYIDFN